MQKARWMIGAIASGLPVGGSKLRVVSWKQLKDALQNCGDIDGIVINSVQMPTAFPQLVDFAPFIYVAHNVEHRSARQNASSAAGARERYLYGRDSRLLQPIEEELCKKAVHVFVLSDDDRSVFELGRERASMLPLVFPPLASSNTNNVAITHDVGLIGTWTWQPNFVGLEWFVREVVPLLNDDIKTAIAGSAPAMIATDHPGLKFVGRVASAEEFVAQSGVLALVSRSGTGVQLKTIEAFQTGMPCVATRSSVRGIAKIPENCRVEDEPGAFATALNQLAGSVRKGDIGRIDGDRFAAIQRNGLHQALRLGLDALNR